MVRLMMGFWIFMLDVLFRTTGIANNIWQKNVFDSLFPGATGESIKTIFDELAALNKLRNRLFHRHRRGAIRCGSPSLPYRSSSLSGDVEDQVLVLVLSG